MWPKIPAADVFDVTALRAELETGIEEHPGEWKVRITAQHRRRILVDVPVPAMGTTPFKVFQAQRPVQEEVTHEDGLLQNGLVSAEVGPDGTVTLTGTDGTVLTGL